MAFNFNTDAYCYVGTGTVYHNIGTGDFTYAAWVRTNYPTGNNSGYTLFTCSSPNNSALVAGDGTGTGKWGLYWSGWYPFDTVLTKGVWYHLIATRQSGILCGYINGRKESTTYDISANSMSNGTIHLNGDSVGNGRSQSAFAHAGLFASGCSITKATRIASGEPANRVLSRCVFWAPMEYDGGAKPVDYGPFRVAFSPLFNFPPYYGTPMADLDVYTNYRHDDVQVFYTESAYTASSSITLGGLTVSSSGTFTKPTYTATTSLSLPALTEAGSGTFTKPTYTASASLTMFNPPGGGAGGGAGTGIYVTASGTFTKPTYTSSSDVSLPGLYVVASGTYTVQSFTGTSAVSLAPLEVSGSGTFSIADRTATSSVSLASITFSSSGTFTPPTYTASSSLSIPGIETSSSGAFTNPTYTASASLSLGPEIVVGSGTFNVYTYAATASLSLSSLTVSSSGTFTTVNTGTCSATLGALTLEGSATFEPPVYTASMTCSFGGLEASGSSTYQTVYAATATLTIAALTSSGIAWLNSPVFYLEWSDSGVSTVVDGLEGSCGLTEVVTGDCTVIDTITGSLRLRLTTTP